MKRACSIPCALALAAAVALPAAGLDLTGTWTGKYTCTEYDGALTRFTVRDDVMAISQNGFAFQVDSQNQFSGVAIPDAKRPDTKGEAKLANCNTDHLVANGGDELARVKVKLDRAKGKGKLKGVSVYTAPGIVGSCRWSYKLTDPANPNASGCN